MNYKIVKTEFAGYGIRQRKSDLYLCISTLDKSNSGIVIFDSDFKILHKIMLSEGLSTGSVFCVLIKDADFSGCYYRIIDGDNEYADPHSEAINGNNSFGCSVSGKDLYSYIPRESIIKGWDNDSQLKTPYADSVFYIAHPRGLTMLNEKVAYKGTFEGVNAVINDLTRLGITGIIFMPVYERLENIKDNLAKTYMNKEGVNTINYWGFGPGYYYAPKKSFSASDVSNLCDEFKSMVLNLHKKGIEVILTFDFNNIPYYEVADILRYWIFNYHIDGFRVFGVNDIYKLINDPFFKDTKLLLENYKDIPSSKSRYKNVAVFDDDFKNVSRKYLKGDDDCVSSMSYFVRENHDNYGVLRNITDFDGFTLNDIVSYDSKHNEANNEGNSDGTGYNYSWNCGEEGISDKKAVNKLRIQQLKNAICLTMLSQGTPVITAGDEVLNSQLGNNNPYCQDNEIGWVNWNGDKQAKEIKKFMKDIIAFRMKHVVLHQPNELKLFDYMSCKLPDVSFHGEEAWKYNTNPESRSFAVLYAGSYAKQYTGKTDASVYVVYNMHWEDRIFALPSAGNANKWKLLFKTDSKCDFNEEKASVYKETSYIAKGRTITVFISE